MPLKKLKNKLENKILLSPHFGIVIKIKQNIIIASKLSVSIGDIVNIEGENEIIGIVSIIEEDSFSIIPFNSTHGCKIGNRVLISNKGLKINVGENLIGRVIDPFAFPLDKKGEIITTDKINIINTPIKAMERQLIDEVFSVGVRSIDALLTCGVGQKMGIFAGSGVGKSTLMGMIVKGAKADIKVIALIGERGREVKEFISKILNDDLTNTIVVVATSDDSPLIRKYGALSAISIAEYFKNAGKNVLFIMDSITRFAMAQREIGLSLGEPPTSKGYPPSTLSLLPQLMERVGKDGNGSITAFFTVLVEGDDMLDPIADQSRSILDGHIVLDRELSEFGIYPPINILSSASRLMGCIINEEHKNNAMKFKRLYSILKDNETLIKIGAYQKGSNKEIDIAIGKKTEMDKFLQQEANENFEFSESIAKLKEICN